MQSLTIEREAKRSDATLCSNDFEDGNVRQAVNVGVGATVASISDVLGGSIAPNNDDDLDEAAIALAGFSAFATDRLDGSDLDARVAVVRQPHLGFAGPIDAPAVEKDL